MSLLGRLATHIRASFLQLLAMLLLAFLYSFGSFVARQLGAIEADVAAIQKDVAAERQLLEALVYRDQGLVGLMEPIRPLPPAPPALHGDPL